ncbi:hypothetical protein L5164_003780 [Vibrio parahaemolyticus]|nr:hypothetical protein [Vibrio parahaemolyticus]
MKGKFISIEGIDGSGKSTIANELVTRLPNTVLISKDVSSFIQDSFVKGQLNNIKKSLWDYPKDQDILKLGSYHWLLLIASWYAALGEQIEKEYLIKGINVIADGWHYKYISRFLLKSEFADDMLIELFKPILSPDKVILLDLSPHVAFDRKKAFTINPSESGAADGFDSSKGDGFVTYQGLVRGNYIDLAKANCWEIIQSDNLSIEESVCKVKKTLS